MQGFGVDIGGSGIKGCPVDLDAGQLIGERVRIETPQPSLPDSVYAVVAQIVDSFSWTERIGVTFPGVMKHGVAHTAANVDKSWLGTDVDAGLSQHIPGDVTTLNDADAAGLAEMRYGAGRDQGGVVLMLTFGTGIGSALFVEGHLVPNTEFGHIQVDGKDAERRASAAVRDREGLSYPEWAKRVDRYLDVLEAGLWPDLIIVGGGVSKKADKWVPLLSTRTPVVAAQLQNDAGIVGAALAAYEAHEASRAYAHPESHHDAHREHHHGGSHGDSHGHHGNSHG
ncbi:MAG TPA: ROK family protein [Blastococcus sp.]|nr:ROK family protein [Blastococcus sp.]